MFSIIFFILLGILGVALIFFDFMQFFSMKVLEKPSGSSQSKVTIVGLLLIVISVSYMIYRFIGF